MKHFSTSYTSISRNQGIQRVHFRLRALTTSQLCIIFSIIQVPIILKIMPALLILLTHILQAAGTEPVGLVQERSFISLAEHSPWRREAGSE